MARQRKNPDFEKALGELEEIVEQLEDGELSLEASLKAFEQGVKLTRECQDALKHAEQKVQVLMADEDGEEREAPLEGDNDDDEAKY